MGDVLPFRPHQPDSARDYWRELELALTGLCNPFATFPVPTLVRDENDPIIKIFGDKP